MVSNNSSFGQDLTDLKSTAREAGQALGLVAEDLIPGDPQEAGEAGAHVSKLGSAADRAGAGIQALDTGSWTGQAADGFHANYLETAPQQWTTAADAFTEVGRALEDYARTLADAQQRAAQAQADLDRANAQSQAAHQQHEKHRLAYNAEASAANMDGPDPSLSPPGAFQDPGAEARAQAQQTIAEAKAAVQAAGDRAAAVVQQAASRAPAQPGLISQALQGVRDEFGMQTAMGAEFAGGVKDGVVGMAEGLAWSATHTSGIALMLDPVGTAEPAASTVAAAAHDPAGAADGAYRMSKTAVDVDQWKSNPVRAVGEVAPAAVGTAAGGSGVAAKGAGAVGKISKAEKAASRVGEAAEKAPRPHPNRPAWHDPDWQQPPAANRPEHVPHEEPVPQLGPREGDGAYHPDSDPKPSSLGERDHHMQPAEQGGLDDHAPNSDARGPGPPQRLDPDPGMRRHIAERNLPQIREAERELEMRHRAEWTEKPKMTAEERDAFDRRKQELGRQLRNLRGE